MPSETFRRNRIADAVGPEFWDAARRGDYY